MSVSAQHPELSAGKCVTVLGAGGFIGVHVTRALLAAGHHVRAFGRRFPNIADMAGATFWHGDFSDPRAIAAALEGADVVIHLIHATFPTAANTDMAGDVARSVIGSIQMLEQAHKSGVTRVIFFSSGGTVYGPTMVSPITEDHPTNPIGAYGVNKLSIEKYVRLYEHLYGMHGFVLRVANPYGPYQYPGRPQGLIPQAFTRLVAGQEIQVFGDGTNVRDYIHVEDVAAAVTALIDYHGPERCFNVGCNGAGRSILDIIGALVNVTGMTPHIAFAPAREFDVPVNLLCSQRLITETGWRPRVSFDAGITQTVAWLQQLHLASTVTAV